MLSFISHKFDLNTIILTLMNTRRKIAYYQKEYELTLTNLYSIWESMTKTQTLGVSGILVAVTLGFQYKEEIREILIIFPFLVLAWGVYIIIQALDLQHKTQYLMALEKVLQTISKQKIPHEVTGLYALIYKSPHFPILFSLSIAPIFIVYMATVFLVIDLLPNHILGLLIIIPIYISGAYFKLKNNIVKSFKTN